MATAQAPALVQTTIAASVPALPPGAEDRLREGVRAYAANLGRALDLVDLAPEVSVAMGVGPPALRIEGADVSFDAPDAPTERGFLDALCAGIYHARELMVSERVACEVWRNWTDGQEPPGPAFQDMLRECVRCGFRAGRLRDVCLRSDPERLAEAARHELFEGALGGLGTCRVELRASADLYARWFDEDGSPRASGDEPGGLTALLELMRDGLFYELGVLVPRVGVRADSEVEAGHLEAVINDLPGISLVVPGPEQFLVNDSPDRMRLLAVEGRPARNPANGMACTIASGGAAMQKHCASAGLTTWDSAGVAVLALSAELKRAACGLVNRGLVELMVDHTRTYFPALVGEVERRIDTVKLTRVLRALVDEGIMIRDLRTVLGGLLCVEGTTGADMSRFIVFNAAQAFLFPSTRRREPVELGPEDLADCVRVALKRPLSHKYTRGQSTLLAYLVAPEIEELIMEGDGPAEPDVARITRAVRGEVTMTLDGPNPPVILTTMEVRRRLWRMTRYSLPRLAVLSYNELSPDMNIQPIARISLAE